MSDDKQIYESLFDSNYISYILWHHTKAEAVRISKTDEQNRQITDENETKIKQWKAKISIFLGSITGRVRSVKLTCEQESKTINSIEPFESNFEPTKLSIIISGYYIVTNQYLCLYGFSYGFFILIMCYKLYDITRTLTAIVFYMVGSPL